MIEQEKVNFINSVSAVFDSLNSRSQDIVSRRFGLKTGSPETLESIGKKYKITRERVRQIEEASLRELRKNFDGFSLSVAVARIKDILRNHGNVAREETLFSEFIGSPDYNKTNAHLVLLMNISSAFERRPEDNQYFSLWTVKDPFYLDRAQSIVAKMVQGFKKQRAVVAEAELAGFLDKSIQDEGIDKNNLLSYASLSKLISKNVFGQWGLTVWPEIAPKGVKDKAYLILKTSNKPLHFKEIAGFIAGYKFDSKKANVQTVHNELIKDSRFVLVGRGLYALSEWGYENGTVKDVMVRILKKHGPLPKDKIIAKTAEVRFVKPNTILLNLQDKSFFRKDEKGFYKLVKEA